MKKIPFLILTSFLVACSSNYNTVLDEESLKYENNSYGKAILLKVIDDEVSQQLLKSNILQDEYNVSQYNDQGIEINSLNYKFYELKDNIAQSCEKIKINMADVYIYSEELNRHYGISSYSPENVILGEYTMSYLPFVKSKQEYVKLHNNDVIKQIKDCTRSYMDHNFLDVDDTARLIADDRFEKFKSEKLEHDMDKAISSKNITWSKLIDLYSELSKNIKEQLVEKPDRLESVTMLKNNH